MVKHNINPRSKKRELGIDRRDLVALEEHLGDLHQIQQLRAREGASETEGERATETETETERAI